MTVDGGVQGVDDNLQPCRPRRQSTITIVDCGGDRHGWTSPSDALDAAGNADGITVTLTSDGGTLPATPTAR